MPSSRLLKSQRRWMASSSAARESFLVGESRPMRSFSSISESTQTAAGFSPAWFGSQAHFSDERSVRHFLLEFAVAFRATDPNDPGLLRGGSTDSRYRPRRIRFRLFAVSPNHEPTRSPRELGSHQLPVRVFLRVSVAVCHVVLRSVVMPRSRAGHFDSVQELRSWGIVRAAEHSRALSFDRRIIYLRTVRDPGSGRIFDSSAETGHVDRTHITHVINKRRWASR